MQLELWLSAPLLLYTLPVARGELACRSDPMQFKGYFVSPPILVVRQNRDNMYMFILGTED